MPFATRKKIIDTNKKVGILQRRMPTALPDSPEPLISKAAKDIKSYREITCVTLWERLRLGGLPGLSSRFV